MTPEEILDKVVRNATFSADVVAMMPHHTGAERTRAIVRRTLEMALGNGMITLTDPDTWPQWVVLDPPYNHRAIRTVPAERKESRP